MKKILMLAVVMGLLVFVLAGCGPDYTEEFNAAVTLYDETVDATEEVWDAAEVVLEESEDVDEIAKALDDVLAADKDALKVIEPMLDEVKGYEEGIADEEAFNDFISAIEEAISVYETDISDTENWKKFNVITDEFIKFGEAYEVYAIELDERAESLSTEAEIIALSNEVIEDHTGYISVIEKQIDAMNEISVSEGEEDVEEIIEEMELAIDLFNSIIETLEEVVQ